MRVLIISHGHPAFSIGGAEIASHALFRAIEATPGHEAFYLARLAPPMRRHAGTPLMSMRRSERETFLHTDRWDEFWLSNSGLEDLAGPFASYLAHVNPDVVHFHHVIGLGVEAIALARRVLPKARLVVTFHEYLPICPNHGQMVKAGTRALCHEASPVGLQYLLPRAQHGRTVRPRAASEEPLLARRRLRLPKPVPHRALPRLGPARTSLPRHRKRARRRAGAPARPAARRPARPLRLLRPDHRVQGSAHPARRRHPSSGRDLGSGDPQHLRRQPGIPTGIVPDPVRRPDGARRPPRPLPRQLPPRRPARA